MGQMRASEAVGTLRLGMDLSDSNGGVLWKGTGLHGNYLHSANGDSGTLGARSAWTLVVECSLWPRGLTDGAFLAAPFCPSSSYD